MSAMPAAPAEARAVNRGKVALAIAFLDLAAFVLCLVWSTVPNGPNVFGDPVSATIIGAFLAVFASMGVLLVHRVPGNILGVVLLATATALIGGGVLQGYWTVGAAAVPPWPAASIVAALTDVWFTVPFVIGLIGVPLFFPDGKLPSRRFRIVVWVTIAGTAMQALAGLLGRLPGLAPDLRAFSDPLTAASLAATVFGFGGASVALGVRFRRGDPVQRQQVKWLLAVVAVAVVSFSLAMVLAQTDSLLDQVCWAIGAFAFLGLPLAIAIAVLRYRLYDIDRVISRTIAYAVVTITLAVVFAGAVLAFQAILAPWTSGSTQAVAASTLVVAALFQPLRMRVQLVVDRRFNRAHYDAERAVATFAAQLRDEVDLESVRADVLGMVAQTVAPASLGLWIRRAEPEG